MTSHLLQLLVAFVAHTTLLFVALWAMIKMQSMEYTFPRLLGCAVLAGGLDMIPLVGHPVAVVTLYFGIWKMTRASMFPDAAFTVVVAYALMFAFHMLVLTALMPDLRPDLRLSGTSRADDGETLGTNQMNRLLDQAVQPAATGTNQATASKAAKLAAKYLVIKGVTRNGDNSSVSIKAGGKTYFATLNKVTLLQTEEGVLSVRPTALGDKTLTLEIGGEPVTLPLP